MYLADSRRSPASDAAPVRRPGRLRGVAGTVLVLGIVSLLTDVSSEMVTAVLPLYLVTTVGLSPLGFGVLDAVYNGSAALMRLLGGFLGDRGGGRYKVVAVIGYALSALCKPVLACVHTLTLLGAVLAVDRTGKGLRTAPRDALISAATSPERRGRAFGVHRAMDTVGALAGPVLAYLILRVAVDGYHAVFVVSSCVAAFGVLVLVLFVPRDPRPASADVGASEVGTGPPQATSGPDGVRALPARRRLRRLTVCAALLGLATVGDSFVYLLLQHRYRLSAEWFPLLPIGTAAVFLLLAAPLGAVADRIGRWRMFLLGHLALLGAYVLLLRSGADGGWFAGAAPVVVLALHGLYYAATDGVLPAAAASAAPAGNCGASLALVGTGQAIGRFVCSLTLGALWTRWGDRAALSLMAAALVGALVVACHVLRGAEPPAAQGTCPPVAASPTRPTDEEPG
ncbi:MFS transporter [Embleya sp. NPDC059237]|uniref:MFS transporter n=1 Tax=Embleya sp. NPDC059237 TaxID=3346784 RepID=UPI0036A77EA7